MNITTIVIVAIIVITIIVMVLCIVTVIRNLGRQSCTLGDSMSQLDGISLNPANDLCLSFGFNVHHSRNMELRQTAYLTALQGTLSRDANSWTRQSNKLSVSGNPRP